MDLPHEVSSFIGRQAQIDAVSRRLRASRCVTLTGPGGIGKTRLALQVARTLNTEFACCWKSLSATVDPTEVGNEIAAALTESIREHNLLLIIDNCEHVIDACAAVVMQLLQAHPGVRVLATSREAVGVPGELIYPVPPLAMADPDDAGGPGQSEAVELFIDRARARQQRLPESPETLQLAARICRALNGVPLAIELAAARTGSMTVAEIASRLDDALTLLTLGSRAAPARQHSLRASLDWSYGLLKGPEQQLLRRLSTLEAEFTVEAAAAVSAFDALQSADIPLLLDRLVSQSLVQARQHKSRMRFSLDGPVRQYAFERLEQAGEAGSVQTRRLEPYKQVRLQSAMSALETPALTPPRPTKPRGVLSERERDVVMLIAVGRSNREIAEELVITKKTAEAHVSHILTKLGLGSRVQIATWSLQQGVTAATAGP